MANILAAQSGNWSSTSTWTGGVLPGPSDTAVANNKTVTIDQDITVALLSTTTTGGATTGGNFLISSVSGTRNISVTSGLGNVAGTYIGGSPMMTISATSGIVDLGSTNIKGGVAVAMTATTGTCELRTTGTVTGGTTANAYGISVSGPQTVRTGSLTGGSNTSAIAVYGAGTLCSIYVTGNVIGGSSTNANGVSGGGYLYISGNVTAGSGAAALSTLTGNIYYIEGTVTGSSGATAIIIGNGNCQITVKGLVSAGTAAGAYGISFSNSTSTLYLAGGAAATSSASAVYAALYDPMIRVRGPLTSGSGGVVPLFTLKWIVDSYGETTWTMRNASDGTVDVSNANLNYPSAADTRSGTATGSGTTGSCVIPSASNVAYGVPVDATTGTAVLTPAAAWAHDIGSGTAAKDRLLATASIDSTGSQIATAVTS